MCQLIESIKVEKGIIHNLEYHIQRMDRSSHALWNKKRIDIDIQRILEDIGSLDPDDTFKLRILYDESEYSYSLLPYQSKKISSLKLIEAPGLEYSHKYRDRSLLNKAYELRSACDDVLICQAGAVKDSLYCNVAFKSEDSWFTPDLALLKGTKRQRLLDEGIITEAEINIEDLPDMEGLCLFNAFIEFGDLNIPMESLDFG